ncbi:MAG: tetratricopeptide repeat protein [Bacteroidetes bacterium]|nr:tetratricopeptide repeat protein [Bacteroidota bacterium]
MKPFCCLILILNLLKANAHVPDSLREISLKLKSDTDRVNFFYNHGFHNRAINPQLSFNCAKLAEEYAQQTRLPYYIAKANNLLGILYYRKYDLAKALSYHKKALSLRALLDDKKGIALSEVNLGNIYTDLKHYELAEQAYLKALQTNNDLNDQQQAGNCLLNLGVLNTELKNYNAARNYFEQAIRNAAKRYDYELQAMGLNNLAEVNLATGAADEAIANCMNSLKMKELMDNEMEMADSYLTMANALFVKKEVKEALACLSIADSIIVRFDYTAAHLISLKLKADYYQKAGNFEIAFVNLKEYNQLKDSLANIEQNLKLNTSFAEDFANNKTVNERAFSFPYIYLNILIVALILVVLFIFKPYQ